MIIEFVINDDARNLIQWLNTRTRGVSFEKFSASFPLPPGSEFLRLEEAREMSSYLTEIRVEMAAFTAGALPMPLGAGIAFEITTPNDKRAKVIAQCKQPDFSRYFTHLMFDICDLWPETRQTITKQLRLLQSSGGEIQQVIAGLATYHFDR